MTEHSVLSPVSKRKRTHYDWSPIAATGCETRATTPTESPLGSENFLADTSRILKTLVHDIELIKSYISIIEEDHLWMQTVAAAERKDELICCCEIN